MRWLSLFGQSDFLEQREKSEGSLLISFHQAQKSDRCYRKVATSNKKGDANPLFLLSNINHSKGRHSCESRNPEKHSPL
jgi:hypothetical protein